MRYDSKTELYKLLAYKLWNSGSSLFEKMNNTKMQDSCLSKAINLSDELSLKFSVASANRNKIKGRVAKKNNDINKAFKYFCEALKIYLVLYPDGNEDISEIYNLIGNCCWECNKFKLAKYYYTKCLFMDIKLHGELHEDIGRDYENLALIENEIGDKSKALEYFFNAKRQVEQTTPENYDNLSRLHSNIGLCLKDLNRPNEGLTYAKKAVQINRSGFIERNDKFAFGLNVIGLNEMELGNFEAAFDCFNEAHTIYFEWFTEVHTRTVNTLRYMGICNFKMGNLVKAKNQLEHCLDLYLQIENKYKIDLKDNKRKVLQDLEKIHNQ